MNTYLNNNSSRLLTALMMVSLASPLAASSKTGEAIGLAYDLNSGELRYRETHCVSADGDQRQVLYQDRADRLIARKMVDYTTGVTTPSFVQDNLYSGESIEVGLEQGAVSMKIIEAGNSSANRTTRLQPDEVLPVVIDAGFDGFVRAHWDALLAGASREFQFPFADRQSLVELRIQPLSCSYQTQTDQCFRLDLANWLLRVLVKPIELGYDAKSRRLTRYRGLSNIGDEQGNGLVVDIRYSYESIPPQACQAIEQTHSEQTPVHTGVEGQS